MKTECCCFRQIEKLDGVWYHTDGTGRQCWPDVDPSHEMFTYMAEPIEVLLEDDDEDDDEG